MTKREIANLIDQNKNKFKKFAVMKKEGSYFLDFSNDKIFYSHVFERKNDLQKEFYYYDQTKTRVFFGYQFFNQLKLYNTLKNEIFLIIG